MTAYRIWTLTCDDCYEIFDPGSPIGLADARMQAIEEGWLAWWGKLGNEDYCRLTRRGSVR